MRISSLPTFFDLAPLVNEMKAYANFVAERIKRFDPRNESLDGFRYYELMEKMFHSVACPEAFSSMK